MQVKLKQTLKDHSNTVSSVAVDTGGDVIASGSLDETVKIWSLKDGECLKTLEGHLYAVRSVSLDGDVIVSGSHDHSLKIWSITTGDCLKTLVGHSDSVRTVAIDDGVLVSGSWDKTIKIWCITSGECLKTLEGHSEYVNSVAIDGNMIVSGSEDKTIKLWSFDANVPPHESVPAEESCLKTFRGHSDYVTCVTMDGDVIVSGSGDQTVKIWSKTSGECLKTLKASSACTITSVAIDGDAIVSGSFDKTVKIWSVATGECLKTLNGHLNHVRSVAIDGNVVVSGSRDETINVWHIDKRHEEAMFKAIIRSQANEFNRIVRRTEFDSDLCKKTVLSFLIEIPPTIESFMKKHMIKEANEYHLLVEKHISVALEELD